MVAAAPDKAGPSVSDDTLGEAMTGLGLGLVMQVMVLAAQNAVVYQDLGAATAAVAFFRQVGAAAGVAVAGAVITWRFAGQTPAPVAFAEAVTVLFGLMSLLLAVGFVLALILPVRPLRTIAYVKELA